MNKIDLAKRRRESLDKLEYIGQDHINCRRVGRNESQRHREAKCLVCDYLDSQEKKYVTEAKFKGGGRADVYVLDDDEAIEILCSETREMLEFKAENYPCKVTPIKLMITKPITFENIKKVLE